MNLTLKLSMIGALAVVSNPAFALDPPQNLPSECFSFWQQYQTANNELVNLDQFEIQPLRDRVARQRSQLESRVSERNGIISNMNSYSNDIAKANYAINNGIPAKKKEKQDRLDTFIKSNQDILVKQDCKNVPAVLPPRNAPDYWTLAARKQQCDKATRDITQCENEKKDWDSYETDSIAKTRMLIARRDAENESDKLRLNVLEQMQPSIRELERMIQEGDRQISNTAFFRQRKIAEIDRLNTTIGMCQQYAELKQAYPVALSTAQIIHAVGCGAILPAPFTAGQAKGQNDVRAALCPAVLPPVPAPVPAIQ